MPTDHKTQKSSRPDAVDFLGYARLMNGTCPKCGTINAHDGTPRCDCEEDE